MEPGSTTIERDAVVDPASDRPSGPSSSMGERGHGSAPADAAAGRACHLTGYHERARTRGMNRVVYWVCRSALVPIFLVYFRMRRIGREHIPSSGAVLFASNHRSFLDPFVIGTLTRRPVYYVAKRELFERRWQAWLLNALGAFPVDRGAGDEQAMVTARTILERGDCVLIFPEGTRVRPGPLRKPRRGVGRLAIETGAHVVPVAVMGTEDVRRGWRIRPRKVSLCCGRPLSFPTAERPPATVVAGATSRIWACVSLQWEWLGGVSAPQSEELLRRASQRWARAA